MKVVAISLFFLNALAFILLVFIYGNQSLNFFWGIQGHFIFLGIVLVADILFSAIVFILPQNWSQNE